MLLRTKKKKYQQNHLKSGCAIAGFYCIRFLPLSVVGYVHCSRPTLTPNFKIIHAVALETSSKIYKEWRKKRFFFKNPYKLPKNQFRAHLKCSDFDGTTTIHLQILSSFRIATDTASGTTGSGQCSVTSKKALLSLFGTPVSRSIIFVSIIPQHEHHF